MPDPLTPDTLPLFGTESVDTELTERNRRILELHEQGVSTREIAALLGCSKSTTARIVKQATT